MDRPALLCAALLAAVPARGGIYGDPDQPNRNHDTRQDLYQVTNPRKKQLADSIVALIDADEIKVQRGRAFFGPSHYGESHGLCRGERFYDQPANANCSGSLVAPDVIMTAGHCVESEAACKATKFVFGYGVKRKGQAPKSLPAGEVYGCSKIIASRNVKGKADQNIEDEDWALVRLDRPVAGHKPLEVNASGSIRDYTPVFLIGHPAGLPAKVAPHGVVTDASHNRTFLANLDAYGGNSGSPVFNAKTGLVEGILIAGDDDFELKGDCQVSKLCANDDCGETVTKISELSRLILGETTYAKTKVIFGELDKTIVRIGLQPRKSVAPTLPNFDGALK